MNCNYLVCCILLGTLQVVTSYFDTSYYMSHLVTTLIIFLADVQVLSSMHYIKLYHIHIVCM